jgi:hypothetical protein
MSPRREKRGLAFRSERAYGSQRAAADPDCHLMLVQISATLRIANLVEPLYGRRMVSGGPAISLPYDCV